MSSVMPNGNVLRLQAPSAYLYLLAASCSKGLLHSGLPHL